MLNPLEIHPPIENCPLCNGPKCFKGLCFNSGNRADMEEVGLFNPYSLTDDYANAKSCFKCGNPYGEPVYVGRSSQPIGCTGCCRKEKDSFDKVTVGVLEMLLANGWGDKKKILARLEKEKRKGK